MDRAAHGVSTQSLDIKEFDIEEVEIPLDDQSKEVVQIGEVELWDRIQEDRTFKIRSCLTGTIISTWVFCIIAGIIRWSKNW